MQTWARSLINPQQSGSLRRVAERGLRALESELGGRVSEEVARLDADGLDDLAAAIRDARRRQAAQLASAGEEALRYIPRLLRAPIRKMFG